MAIPGSVGSAACDIWLALRLLLQPPQRFAVWPFDGPLESLLATRGIVIAEMYPRAAYATALIDGRPNDRPRLALAKTAPHVRQASIDQMQAMRWVRYSRVQFDGLEWALDNEDDFDACMTPLPSSAALSRNCRSRNRSMQGPLPKAPFSGPAASPGPV